MGVDGGEGVGALLGGGDAVAGHTACLKGYAVNDVERLRAGGERVGAAHQDAHPSAWRAVALLHLHAGNLALDGMGDVYGATLAHVVALEL